MSPDNNNSDTQQNGGAQARFWFYRKGGIVKGPFPAAMLQRFVILGRLDLDTEVSMNRKRWDRLRQVPELVPEEVKTLQRTGDPADLEAARIRNDERLRDRRAKKEQRADERRQHLGRRKPESEAILHHRENVQRMLDARRKKSSPVLSALTLLLIAGLIGWGGWYIIKATPKQQTSAQDCHSVPKPGVNWSSCKMEGVQARSKVMNNANLSNADVRQGDFHGANLSNSSLSYVNFTRADLSYADLTGSRLVGSRLDGADLSNARMDGADLSYASLIGANIGGLSLKGARLHKTIWVDGRVCGPDSVGTCR